MRQFLWGALIAVLIIGVVAEVSFLYWQYSRIQSLERQMKETRMELKSLKEKVNNFSESTDLETKESVVNTSFESGQDIQANSSEETANTEEKEGIYNSQKYGFQLEVPEDYKDYKVTVEDHFESDGVAYIYFLFETSDSEIVSAKNFVTGEEFPGYISVFAISAWEKNAYQELKEQCEIQPNPGCPTGIIGENENYFFEASLGNGVVPEDLLELRNMLNASSEKTLKQILEFETI